MSRMDVILTAVLHTDNGVSQPGGTVSMEEAQARKLAALGMVKLLESKKNGGPAAGRAGAGAKTARKAAAKAERETKGASGTASQGEAPQGDAARNADGQDDAARDADDEDDAALGADDEDDENAEDADL